MPAVVPMTFRAGVLVPDGWRLVRSLRGRAIYAYYSEADVTMVGAIYVPSATLGAAVVQRMVDSTEEELVGLLNAMNVG